MELYLYFIDPFNCLITEDMLYESFYMQLYLFL